MNKFSNILKVPPFTDLYKEFMNKIANKMKTIEPTSDVPSFSIDKKPEDVIMSVMDTPEYFGVSALYEEGEYSIKRINDLTEKDEKFVLHLNVMEIFPQTVYDIVSIVCQTCVSR